MAQPENDPLQKLVDSFQTLLDDTLVTAIASDYDLTTHFGYKAAEDTLKDLSQNVTLEEATGFDPSGFGYQESVSSPRDDVSTSTTTTSRQTSHAKRDESSSTDVSSLPADPSPSIPKLTTFNDDSDETKLDCLRGMFSELKEYDVRHALKKANGDFQTALDDLLNVQFLQSTGQQQRGIDAFFEPEEASTTGKKKKKNKNKKSVTKSPEFAVDSTSKEVIEKSQAKELKHQDEISFLADRMSMPFDQISDIYYRKKCSIGATAAEIIDIYTSLGLSSEGEEAEAKVKKMAAKYPNIPEGHLYTLLQVVSTSSARAYSEISDILSKHFAKKPWTQRLDLSYRTTPLPDEELEGPLGALPSRSSSNASPRTPISGKPGGARATKSDPSSQVDLTQAIERISTSHQAKRETSAYASQLYRRGASNSLYRQAAVVYRERANEHCAAAHQLTSTAADLLVEQASTKTSIDLHGVTVRDGSRIAQEKARQWWDSLGEFRSRKAREQPLTIITGIGRHTTSGVSQLRQAVAATLLQDGWKMQVETGRFVLSGRR